MKLSTTETKRRGVQDIMLLLKTVRRVNIGLQGELKYKFLQQHHFSCLILKIVGMTFLMKKKIQILLLISNAVALQRRGFSRTL